MSKVQQDESCFHKASSEVVVINYPVGFPLLTDVCVCEKRTNKGGKIEYLPIKTLRGITSPSHPKAQEALMEEKHRRMEIERRSELSETVSS